MGEIIRKYGSINTKNKKITFIDNTAQRYNK